jgi:pimeloyl-ACP methyl ester carboxylesterase
MATFVLVHPAWFGGWCWNRVVPRLRAAGHAAYAPTLTGLGERAHLCAPTVGLSIHIEDVLQVLSFEELDDVVLVGNSSAGTVITGVADRVRERIRRVVYLDAFVPADGQSTFDLIAPERRAVIEGLVESEGYGWLLPRFAPTPWEQFVVEAWQVIDEADLQWVLARLRPTPFRHFTEPLHLRHTDAEQPQRVNIRCRGTPHPGIRPLRRRGRIERGLGQSRNGDRASSVHHGSRRANGHVGRARAGMTTGQTHPRRPSGCELGWHSPRL